jgi:hypothetical protein
MLSCIIKRMGEKRYLSNCPRGVQKQPPHSRRHNPLQELPLEVSDILLRIREEGIIMSIYLYM